MTFKKHIICMVYGLRELKNKSWDNSEWVKNGDFCYYLMRLIATWGASCRHDSASPKTGAWSSLEQSAARADFHIWCCVFIEGLVRQQFFAEIEWVCLICWTLCGTILGRPGSSRRRKDWKRWDQIMQMSALLSPKNQSRTYTEYSY